MPEGTNSAVTANSGLIGSIAVKGANSTVKLNGGGVANSISVEGENSTVTINRAKLHGGIGVYADNAKVEMTDGALSAHESAGISIK